MPHLFYFTTDEEKQHANNRVAMRTHKENVFNRTLHSFSSWLRRKEEEAPSGIWIPKEDILCEKEEPNADAGLRPSSRALDRRPTRPVVPGLPRPITFKRQNSEKRHNLFPVEPRAEEKRASSVDRRHTLSRPRTRTLSPPCGQVSRYSTSDVPGQLEAYRTENNVRSTTSTLTPAVDPIIPQWADDRGIPSKTLLDHEISPSLLPSPAFPIPEIIEHEPSEGPDDRMIQKELEDRWILNLSMHFRDMSDREKFFITYAETPSHWRRVTISVDYRNKPPDSLEADLKNLHYQRDKSARIYESIRASLPEIQFYPTVTNLKLETEEGRLHVHVTEDVNEIIPYPQTTILRHITTNYFRESSLQFESHISGFVYKIVSDGKTYIKKEIPGPDAVDEFLYEINALSSLANSNNIIKFEGLIVDDNNNIKGLLLSFAEQGALVDLIYDWKNTPELTWKRRERWAKQIVEGLAEIHDAAFVQGDFTLSNIVVDAKDDAKIIDINRRGCPVGWEPPELEQLIHSGQRIGMYIGVKSDLFQLGMVLWALAEQNDEPERCEPPLRIASDFPVPDYFREIVNTCLDKDPRNRKSARQLLDKFPVIDNESAKPLVGNGKNSQRRSLTEYIDPATAVEREDIERARHSTHSHEAFPNADTEFPDGLTSTEYQFGTASSSASYVDGRRRSSPAPRRSSLTDYSRSDFSLDNQVQYGPQLEILPGEMADRKRASFRDHVLQHRHSYDSELKQLENEVGTEETPQVSRQNTLAFDDKTLRLPVHQDSGFAEELTTAIEKSQYNARLNFEGAKAGAWIDDQSEPPDSSTPRRRSNEDSVSRFADGAAKLLRSEYSHVKELA